MPGLVAAGEGCSRIAALAVGPDVGLDYVPLPATGLLRRTIILAWRSSEPRGGEIRTLARRLRDLSPEGVEALAAG